MFKKLAIAAALAAVASSACAAESKGFYGGLDVGSTKVDNLDGNKTSAGGFLGYGFNQYVALELGYRELGKWNINGGTIKLGQTHLSVVGTYPLSPEFAIFGRLGNDAVRVDSSVQGATFNDHPGGVFFGAGLNYKFTPTISGRAEIQKPTRDSTNYGVGIVFKF